MQTGDGWTADPVALFTNQVILWVAPRSGRVLDAYVQAIGSRWLPSLSEVEKLALSIRWRKSSHPFAPYADPLSPSSAADLFPSNPPPQEYRDLAVRLLREKDARLFFQALDSLQEDGLIELVPLDGDRGTEELEYSSKEFRGYNDADLRAVLSDYSADSITQFSARSEQLNMLVVLTAKGRTKVQAMRVSCADDRKRREAARDALLDYLHAGTPQSPWIHHFQQDPRGFYFGRQFQEFDSFAAASYLKDKDLIRDRPTSTLLGDTLEITAAGTDCIEKNRGSVSAFLAAQASRIEVVMGDRFENIHDSTIINKSLLVNAMNVTSANGMPDVTEALAQVAELIDKSGSRDAADTFSAFVEELQAHQPRKSVLRACWNGVITALPSIAQLVDATAKIATLFH